MLKHTEKKRFKVMLSATAVALALVASPVYAQTGYIPQSQPGGNTDARMGGHVPQAHTAYGTGTTASARGGEIITRTGQQSTATTTIQARERAMMDQPYYGTRTTTTYQQHHPAISTPAPGTRFQMEHHQRQAGSASPAMPQQRYTPDHFSRIEPSVGSAQTTIDRVSPATRETLYRSFDEQRGVRIDQRLGAAVSEPRVRRQPVTPETHMAPRLNQ